MNNRRHEPPNVAELRQEYFCLRFCGIAGVRHKKAAGCLRFCDVPFFHPVAYNVAELFGRCCTKRPNTTKRAHVVVKREIKFRPRTPSPHSHSRATLGQNSNRSTRCRRSRFSGSLFRSLCTATLSLMLAVRRSLACAKKLQQDRQQLTSETTVGNWNAPLPRWRGASPTSSPAASRMFLSAPLNWCAPAPPSIDRSRASAIAETRGS